MEEIITRNDINKHIEKIFSLLRQQEYTSLTTELTRKERKRLYEFFYEYGRLGEKKLRFTEYGSYFYIRTEDKLYDLNQAVYSKLDDELEAIIEKCGVSPERVFVLQDGTCGIDKRLSNAMHALQSAEIDDYYILCAYDHPVDRDSIEIQSFKSELQDAAYERAKDGEITFKVSYRKDEIPYDTYYHNDGLHFGGYIKFNNVQIGGNFASRGMLYDENNSIIYDPNGLLNVKKVLMPFFLRLEETLTNNLADDNSKKPKETHIG